MIDIDKHASTKPKEDYVHIVLVVCLVVAYGIAVFYGFVFWIPVAILLILDGFRLAYKRKRKTANGDKLDPLGVTIIGLGVVLGFFLFVMWVK